MQLNLLQPERTRNSKKVAKIPPPMPRKAVPTLSGVKTPYELKTWCLENIKSIGRLCRCLHTAEQMVVEKAGCDWEVSNFVLHELKCMGYEANVLFITRNDHAICRASVVYRDEKNNWWWFLWCPESRERVGIWGGFVTVHELMTIAKGCFEIDFKLIDYSVFGNTEIEPNWTFVEYLAMVDSWEQAPKRRR